MSPPLPPLRHVSPFLHRTAGHLQRQCLRCRSSPQTHPIRPLTSTAHLSAAGQSLRNHQPKRASIPSMALAQKNQARIAMTSGDLPQDIGPMPGTFIMPSSRSRPNWGSDWRRRWKLEKMRLLARWQDVGSIFIHRFFKLDPRPKATLKPLRLPAMVETMHGEMFGAFATGEMSAVARKLCPGLLGSLRARIAARPDGTYLKWRVVRRLSKPRLLSYRVALLPPLEGKEDRRAQMGYVQGVVQLHTSQAVVRVKKIKKVTQRKGGKFMEEIEVVVDGQGKQIDERSPEEVLRGMQGKETKENWMAQSMIKKSEMQPWLLWGTVEEASLEKLEREEKKLSQANKKDELRKAIEGRESVQGAA